MRRLNRSVVSGGVVYPAGTASTDELEAAITNQSVWDGDVESVADPVPPADPAKPLADPGVPYGDRSKAELEDAIAGRNATRAEQKLEPLKVAGKNKQDLIDALQGDDSSS